MQINDRVRLITKMLVPFLRQFSTPHHLDTEHLELQRVRDIAETMNAGIMSGMTQDLIEHRIRQTFQVINQTYKGSAWPSPAHFFEAMEKSRANSAAALPAPQAPAGSAQWPDLDAISAKRIKAREPVGETYVWGTGYHRLIEKRLIEPEDVDLYRKQSRATAEKLHGEQKARDIIDEKIMHGFFVQSDSAISEDDRARCRRIFEEMGDRLKQRRRGAA